jgi:hypothetical protein
MIQSNGHGTVPDPRIDKRFRANRPPNSKALHDIVRRGQGRVNNPATDRRLKRTVNGEQPISSDIDTTIMTTNGPELDRE